MSFPPGTPSAPTIRDLELRCQIYEIGEECAQLMAGKFRKVLLGHRCPQVGNAAAAEAPAPPEAQAPEPVRRDEPVHRDEPVRRDDTEPERDFFGIITKLCARNRTGTNNRTAIFRAAGLRDRKLEPEEAVCAKRTPEISWMAFCKLFGGFLHSERRSGNRVLGYESDMAHFLCTSSITQPFAPTRIGGPGVILSSPGATLHKNFHVFVDPSPDGRKTTLRYCGVYTTAHVPMEVGVDEWHSLPTQCTRGLLKHLRRTKVGDVHARCTLRKRKGFASDPSPAEILEWTRQYRLRSEVMEPRAIRDSFNSGEEKYYFEAIECIGYDVQLARIIRGNNHAR